MDSLKKFYVGLLLLNAICITASAQLKTTPDIQNEAISPHAMDSLRRGAFAKMVAGTENIASMANYISLVPTDGKFTLSGNVFFKSKNTGGDSSHLKARPYEYFALGFSGSGSIQDGSVATLFNKAKFNTGTDFGLKFSWCMNSLGIGSISPDNYQMIDRRNALYRERDKKIDSVKNEISGYRDSLQRLSLKISELNRKNLLIIADTAMLRDSVNVAKTDSEKLKRANSLALAKQEVFMNFQKLKALNANIAAVQELYDVSTMNPELRFQDRSPRQRELSYKYGLTIHKSYTDTAINKIVWDYQSRIDSLGFTRPVSGLKLNWLSVIGDWNRLSYYAYDPALSFDDAISQHFFDGFTAGLQFNFYTLYKPVRKASLFNIALLVKKTNNLSDLSTSTLTDETTVTNANTDRKSSNSYDVYTDPIEVYTTIQVPVNYYHFFGKNLGYGYHVYGLADWRNTHKDIYNVGAGLIFGLNDADNKRVLSVELFATYEDLKRDLVADKTDSKWKQLQVGFSIAIPFLIYKN